MAQSANDPMRKSSLARTKMAAHPNALTGGARLARASYSHCARAHEAQHTSARWPCPRKILRKESWSGRATGAARSSRGRRSCSHTSCPRGRAPQEVLSANRFLSLPAR